MKEIPCPISVEALKDLYEIQKLTDDAIALRIGAAATIKRVRSWRRRFGIHTINRTERHDVPEIEGRLRSLLIGSMLGDGRLARGVHTTRYVENHAVGQKDYAEWKRQQWGLWVPRELKPVVWKKKDGEFPGVRFETVSHVNLNEWRELFYDGANGYKRLRNELLPMVEDDAFALAVWYLDDGCAEWWPTITMATAQREVAGMILERFGLFPIWKLSSTSATTGAYVLSGEPNAHLFISLVRPHIPECMAYKLQFGFQGAHYQVRNSVPEIKLREMSSRGVPIKRIAMELGAAETTVRRYLVKHGIEHPRKIGRPTNEL
jgi:hypothetical protein